MNQGESAYPCYVLGVPLPCYVFLEELLSAVGRRHHVEDRLREIGLGLTVRYSAVGVGVNYRISLISGLDGRELASLQHSPGLGLGLTAALQCDGVGVNSGATVRWGWG